MSLPVRKLNALTGLRFVAAAMIVLHHAKGYIFLSNGFLEGYNLSAGVSFFFVLSGFLLTYAYGDLSTWEARGRFLLARIGRLWPAHLFSFALLMVVLPASLRLSPGSVTYSLLYVGMLHAWVPRQAVFFSYNSVSWSISTEFAFYLCFILLIPRWRRTWHVKLLVSALLLAGLLIVSNRPVFRSPADPLHDVSMTGLAYVQPLARLLEFVLGMTMALLWSKLRASWRPGRAVGTVLELAALAAAALSIKYVTVYAWAHMQSIPWTGIAGAAWFCGWGASSVFFAFVILLTASETGWISWVLASRPCVLLGEISYSVYLLHMIFIRHYSIHHHSIGGWQRFVVFWAILLASSWLTWIVIERPGRRMILALWPGRSSRHSSPADTPGPNERLPRAA